MFPHRLGRTAPGAHHLCAIANCIVHFAQKVSSSVLNFSGSFRVNSWHHFSVPVAFQVLKPNHLECGERLYPTAKVWALLTHYLDTHGMCCQRSVNYLAV